MPAGFAGAPFFDDYPPAGSGWPGAHLSAGPKLLVSSPIGRPCSGTDAPAQLALASETELLIGNLLAAGREKVNDKNIQTGLIIITKTPPTCVCEYCSSTSKSSTCPCNL